MPHSSTCLILFASLLSTAVLADETEPAPTESPPAAHAPVRWPGLQLGGDVLLPNQWSLRPAGKQVPLGDFPVNVALHPGGLWAAVLHAGYGDHEIVVVDLQRDRVVSRVLLDQAFYGLCFDAAGERLFAGGAEQALVHAFRFEEGYLSAHRELPLAEAGPRCVPAGMAYRAADDSLVVADGWGDAVHILPLGGGQPRRVELEKDSYPYAVLIDPAGRLFVSLWGREAVAVVHPESLRVEALWKTDKHPTEMALAPDGARLFVACSNSNTVSVIDTASGAATEVIGSALYPAAPPGSTPNSLALSADGRVLLVANADNNNLALFDVGEPGGSRSLGFIPVGWYPTSVRFDARGRILVANGKGLASKANARGPNPLTDPPPTIEEYIGGLFDGTLSVIDPPGPADMAAYSQDAYAASPLRADRAPVVAPRDEDNPIPAKVGDPSPIRHCIYIIKENRTYDQVFGDLPEGNGDESLCIFPERVTPNHHALARRFVLLDNFYVESEVSADGHEWSMAAYATDFVEKTWPLVYRGGSRILTYPSEGAAEIAFPAGGYIWDRCKEAGVTYRSYGEFVDNGPTPDAPATTAVEALEGHFDPFFRSFDTDYPDAKRADRFLEELARFEREGQMPQFIVLRLPNDHTVGQSVGKPTPTAMVADNDLALGRVVEAVSRSSFWPTTAIFVIQDDAQNGSDHVDAHRTVALAIGPHIRGGGVDSTMYSTASMLRTIELILGLEPMSQFDAAATPMYASFQGQPDLAPFAHLPANVDLDERNLASAWGAKLSEELDFTREDRADDLLLNEIVWRSVRGADSPMPPPVRASFVITLPEGEEEED